MRGAMRHHWLLLGACGWVLLILMFASRFISYRAVDAYRRCTLHSTYPSGFGSAAEEGDLTTARENGYLVQPRKDALVSYPTRETEPRSETEEIQCLYKRPVVRLIATLQ